MTAQRDALTPIAVALATAGALLALVSSFLPWLSGETFDANYWRGLKVQDILLVPTVLAVLGLAAAVLLWPRVGLVRLASIAVTAGLISFVFPNAVEFIHSDVSVYDSEQAGEFVALIASGVLVGALVVQLVELAPGDRTSRSALTVAGLILLALAGLLQPFVELLPIEGDTTYWEINDAADILRAFAGLATAAIALAAIVAPRWVGLPGAAFLLGCYTATGNVVGSVEALAFEVSGAEPFVSLFLLAPLGIAGAVLVAVGSRFRVASS